MPSTPSSSSASLAAPSSAAAYDADTVLQDTVRWLERAVIDLNLCPFAKGVHTKGQIHYCVSSATDTEALAHDLARELQALAQSPPEQRDTTLLVAPGCLQDFLDFNDFMGVADGLLESLDLDGILQIANFHPQFQFAGTLDDDVTNCTNRSPYPTLHLIREASIDRAVAVFPEAETIFERNIEVLEGLGLAGWNALDVGARCPVAHQPTQDKA